MGVRPADLFRRKPQNMRAAVNQFEIDIVGSAARRNREDVTWRGHGNHTAIRGNDGPITSIDHLDQGEPATRGYRVKRRVSILRFRKTPGKVLIPFLQGAETEPRNEHKYEAGHRPKSLPCLCLCDCRSVTQQDNIETKCGQQTPEEKDPAAGNRRTRHYIKE